LDSFPLYNCNDDTTNSNQQLFSIAVGLPTTTSTTTRNDNDYDDHDDKFEIRPINGIPNRCISQMHHPKKLERLYPEDCNGAHRDDTGYWITF
jgi:hypothetical protein